jgi:flagellar basal body rod protein FlgG
MTNRASGTFEVKLTPQDEGPDAPVGRMMLDKQFQGDLTGTSKGQMLMASSSSVPGSAGYVAIEKVTGTLNGRSGSFYLQHSGTMTRGAGELSINVMPDTGTDELIGLQGKLNIIIADGKHSYEFDYSLGET